MNKLRIVLILQLALFFGWASYLLVSKNSDSPEFCLETEPVDPRDLISGTYVALNYRISSPQAPSCTYLTANALSMYVRLQDSGRTVNTVNGPVPVYDAAECSAEARDGLGWVRAAIQPSSGRAAVTYGIERFFLNENDPRKDARSGSVVARVKIGANRQLVLLDLANKI
ncbi:MAG: GDYXXLXY domain-containing protein [Elusimicrobia bacterium]|nr:GDYXXLXY domain-containing protein [Elusimicrobiota bacterium]